MLEGLLMRFRKNRHGAVNAFHFDGRAERGAECLRERRLAASLLRRHRYLSGLNLVNELLGIVAIELGVFGVQRLGPVDEGLLVNLVDLHADFLQ